MNTKHLGANQKALIKFLHKHPGWQSYSPDATTTRTAMSLLKRGLVEVNAHHQIRMRQVTIGV